MRRFLWVFSGALLMFCGCGPSQKDYIANLEESVKPLIQKDLTTTAPYFGLSEDAVHVSEVKLTKPSRGRNYYAGQARINFKPIEIDGKRIETKSVVDNLGARVVPVTYEYFIDVQVVTEKQNDDMFSYKYDTEKLALAIGEYTNLIMQVARGSAQ